MTDAIVGRYFMGQIGLRYWTALYGRYGFLGNTWVPAKLHTFRRTTPESHKARTKYE